MNNMNNVRSQAFQDGLRAVIDKMQEEYDDESVTPKAPDDLTFKQFFNSMENSELLFHLSGRYI